MQKYDVRKPTFQYWASVGFKRGIPHHGFSMVLAKRYGLSARHLFVRQHLSPSEAVQTILGALAAIPRCSAGTPWKLAGS